MHQSTTPRTAVVYEVQVHQSPYYTDVWLAVATADGHDTGACYGMTRERAVANAMSRIDELVGVSPARTPARSAT